MIYLLRPIFHLRHVRKWSDPAKASLDLSPQDFTLKISLGARTIKLDPRLLATLPDGRQAYTKDFGKASVFVGWVLPNSVSWPAASDKMTFKQTAANMGLKVPKFWLKREDVDTDFIIKLKRGSFSRDMSGPYKPGNADVKNGSDNQYFDQFITGRTAKAWCWNGSVVALEMLSRPYFIGDGVRSLKALATGVRGSMDSSYDLSSAVEMLAWQGFTEDSVPPLGKKVFLDFKYTTPFDKLALDDRNVWEATEAAIKAQFSNAAARLHGTVPESAKDRALFTLDAVVDDSDQVWFLEMNSHPMIHPTVYPAMLASLFAGV